MFIRLEKPMILTTLCLLERKRQFMADVEHGEWASLPLPRIYIETEQGFFPEITPSVVLGLL